VKISAIIIEDEKISRDILKNYLKKYCPNVDCMGEADNIQDGKELIESTQPDLVFLDVEMPYGTGFDLLEQLPERSFETIFVTAYDHYAIEALNNRASYYLLKPISIDDLIKAVASIVEVKEREVALENTVLTANTSFTKGKITLPQQDGFEVIDVNDIVYCKADDNYTEVHLTSGKRLVSKTLKYFETLLQEYPFVRVHKSYLVNINTIVKYRKGKGGSVLLENGQEIMVSATKKANLLSYFK
jgi:two-component system LytT family response regulator